MVQLQRFRIRHLVRGRQGNNRYEVNGSGAGHLPLSIALLLLTVPGASEW